MEEKQTGFGRAAKGIIKREEGEVP